MNKQIFYVAVWFSATAFIIWIKGQPQKRGICFLRLLKRNSELQKKFFYIIQREE